MTASEAIARAQSKRPSITAADGLVLLNDVHNEILSRVNLQSDIETIATLSATTRLYDLTTTVKKVWWCRYQLSSTENDYVELKPTTVDTLEYENYVSNSGTPPSVYFTTHKSDGTMQIGIHPLPAATSGSYPSLILRVTRATALTVSPDSDLPLGAPSFKAWWRGIVAYWDELKGHEEEGKSIGLYNQAIQELLTWKQTQNAKVLPSAAPTPSYHYPTRI